MLKLGTEREFYWENLFYFLINYGWSTLVFYNYSGDKLTDLDVHYKWEMKD